MLAEDEPSGVGAFLRGLGPEALVKLILERAEEDDALAAWLLVKAQGKAVRSPKAALRTIERAFRLEGGLHYDDTATVVAHAEQAVDLLEAMLKARDWSTAADLSEYALRLGFGAMEQVDDSDGELGMMLQRVADIHARACGRGGVSSLQLADRLFALIMGDPWDAISLEPYRKALGRDGMDRFRDIVRREWEKLPALKPGSRAQDPNGKRYTLTALMRWLAAGSRDTDALIAIEQRDLSHPSAFLRVAELLKKAKRDDEALIWGERGAASFPGEPTDELRDFLVGGIPAAQAARPGARLALGGLREASEPGALPCTRALRRGGEGLARMAQARTRLVAVEGGRQLPQRQHLGRGHCSHGNPSR